MDFDSDGFITPKEFEAFRTILACAGLDDCVVMDWIELFEKFADEDNKVPIKKVGEFVKLMDALEETEEESPEERQATRNLLYFFDENGDGKLSKTEVKIECDEVKKRSLIAGRSKTSVTKINVIIATLYNILKIEAVDKKFSFCL